MGNSLNLEDGILAKNFHPGIPDDCVDSATRLSRLRSRAILGGGSNKHRLKHVKHSSTIMLGSRAWSTEQLLDLCLLYTHIFIHIFVCLSIHLLIARGQSRRHPTLHACHLDWRQLILQDVIPRRCRLYPTLTGGRHDSGKDPLGNA